MTSACVRGRGPVDSLAARLARLFALTPRWTRYVPHFPRASARPRGYDCGTRRPQLTLVTVIRLFPRLAAVHFTCGRATQH